MADIYICPRCGVSRPCDCPVNSPEPPPTATTTTPIWELVIEDMKARDRFGEAKYGQRLTAFNGRSALIDAYQEALDLCVYLRQQIEEDRQNGR